MDHVQRAQLRQSEIKSKLSELLDMPAETRAESHDADLKRLTLEIRSAETELQAALLLAPDAATIETPKDAEGDEFRELRSKVELGSYVRAAVGRVGVSGAEAEYNAALGLPGDHFPLELLTPAVETRAAVDGDAGTTQASWIERLFSDTAAQYLGVSMPSVPPGVSAYPVLGSNASPAQRGRAEASVDATISATVTEIKPTRSAVSATYSVEDNARLPGFAEAIGRDLSAAMTEKIDRTIFLGDSTANENSADITGLTGVTGVAELTLTQAEKVKADEVLKELAGLIDGKYAASLADVRLVATVGSNQLWLGTIHNSAASNQTIAEFLRSNGVTWTTRGDIETNTANGDFGAFVGLSRGIANTAVAPVWMGAQLINDPYSGAKKGEVTLTLSYLWGFAVPRVSNYRRLKYVT